MSSGGLAGLMRETAGRRLLVALDFDGTLCEFTARPEAARLTVARRKILLELSTGLHHFLILSGRSLADLRKRVGVGRIHYGGNFGLELEGPGLRFQHSGLRAFKRPLELLRRGLSAFFKKASGVIVEGKKWGICLHCKGAATPREVEFLARAPAWRNPETRPGLRWVMRENAWEIFPDLGWAKGEATLFVWRRLREPLLVVIGDDPTDEGAFKASRGRGTSAKVGPGRTSARYRLKDIDEVYSFLTFLKK